MKSALESSLEVMACMTNVTFLSNISFVKLFEQMKLIIFVKPLVLHVYLTCKVTCDTL
jgi:hypothetical protein